jgi:hypothetical protein
LRCCLLLLLLLLLMQDAAAGQLLQCLSACVQLLRG